MKHSNKNAFSIIMALWLTLLMSLLVLFLLEFIIPYTKNVKGIENSINAYYQAEWAVEEALLHFDKESFSSSQQSSAYSSDAIDSKYDTEIEGNIIPPAGKWNSEFSKDYNMLSILNGVQLEVWNNRFYGTFWDVKVYLKVPNTSTDSLDLKEWTNAQGQPIHPVWWYLASEGNSLSAVKDSFFEKADVCNSQENNCSGKSFSWKKGKILNGTYAGTERDIETYYNNHCWAGSWCQLILLLQHNLETTTWVFIPALEYEIDFWWNVPLYNATINASWKSSGFQKDLEVTVSQQSWDASTNFAIIQ